MEFKSLIEWNIFLENLLKILKKKVKINYKKKKKIFRIYSLSKN